MNAEHQPPDHLDDQAKAKWAEMLPVVEQINEKVDQGTLDALAAYAAAWSRWVSAEAKVAELGTVVKSPVGGPQLSPYLSVAAAAQRQLRQWGDSLGLNPAARKKLAKKKAAATPQPQQGSGGLLADLLTRGNGSKRAKAATRN